MEWRPSCADSVLAQPREDEDVSDAAGYQDVGYLCGDVLDLEQDCKLCRRPYSGRTSTADEQMQCRREIRSRHQKQEAQ